MLNYVKIYYMSVILGGKNMNKWEDKYSKLKNGEFDARIDELKDKANNKTATKEEYKEYEKLSKSKNNLGKVENVLEYREKLKEELNELKQEVETRKDAALANQESKKLEEELVKITEEIIKTEKELKDPEIKEDRKKYSEVSYQLFREQFDARVMASRHIELYQKLVKDFSEENN